MKILIVGLDSSNSVGGIETYLLKVVSNIDRSKYQFEFLAFKGTTPCFFNEFKSMGCNFHFVTSRRKNLIKNILDINNLLQREKFDVVHCNFNSLSYITPCSVALRLKIPVIVHSRNAGCLQGRLSRLLHKVNFFRMKFMPVVRISVSDLAGIWMFGKNSKFEIFNNGVDLKKFFFDSSKRLKIRQELHLDSSHEVIVNVGAFRKQKNHSFLIDVFAEYLKINDNSILVLVGEGPLKQDIEYKVRSLGISSKVVFLRNRNDVPDILCAADKFLFPSFYEGFPNALLEAESVGLLCVTSNVVTKDVLVPGFCQYVSLDAPINDWLEALKKNSCHDRCEASNAIKRLGLDTDSEMKRLSCLYDSCAKKS